MGVESSALFVRWADDGSSRDFDLTDDLIVITAHTGDEYPDSGMLVERHIRSRAQATSKPMASSSSATRARRARCISMALTS
jgi:hypothetical protein